MEEMEMDLNRSMDEIGTSADVRCYLTTGSEMYMEGK